MDPRYPSHEATVALGITLIMFKMCMRVVTFPGSPSGICQSDCTRTNGSAGGKPQGAGATSSGPTSTQPLGSGTNLPPIHIGQLRGEVESLVIPEVLVQLGVM